jgi:CheY-like chemotaxis protein
VEFCYLRLRSKMKDNIKILLVDDNSTFINALRTMLLELIGSESCLIKCANNGFEAIDILKNSTFDYIFIDIFMPILDGIEILKIFNRDYYNRYTVLIAVTFSSDSECIMRSMNAGARYFLRKDKIEPRSLAQVFNSNNSD